MNILIVTEAFYPDDVGGAHIYVKHYADGLAKRGHAVSIITIRLRKDMPYYETIGGINVYRYDSAARGGLAFILRPLLSIINSRRLFRKISRKTRFDIISCQSILPTAGILHCAKKKNIPVMYTFHSSLLEDVKLQSKKKRYTIKIVEPAMFYVIRSIERMCYRGARKIVVLSDFSRKYLNRTFGIPDDKVVTIPGGVDLDTFSPRGNKIALREAISLPADKILLVTVRRLVARMGLENLVSSISEVCRAHRDMLLLIIGEGFIEARLREIIEKNSLDDYVKLLGRKDIAEVAGYLQASDLFILPTEEAEWFGLVTLEAMACGLPVIATPVGGTVEIIKKINSGLLLDGTSARDLAVGILKMISLRKEWAVIGNSCRDYVVNNYSWEKVVLLNESLLSGDTGK